MKEYLVILAGSPRGGEATWNSLYKYVIDYLDADLAICCSNKWDTNISLFKKAKYIWTFEEMDDYSDYYKNNFSGNWREYFDLGVDEDGVETGLYSSGSIHFVFKDFIRKNYLDLVTNYKNIIYTRFDQYYVDYHPKITTDQIYIPEGEDYFGICDRHAAFPSKYTNQFLNICGYIDNPKSLLTNRSYINCETTFKDHMVYEGLNIKIKRYPRSQFTASLQGEHTNWRVAKYRIYFKKNLMTKYPGEFTNSIYNLINESTFFKALIKESLLTLNYLYLKCRIWLGKFKNL